METQMMDTMMLEVHPLAKCFPPLSLSDFERLRDDIAANGQKVPVTVTHDRLLLDGHHRVLALRELDICDVLAWPPLPADADLMAEVVALNAHRRQMTTTDLAVTADLMSKESEGKVGRPSKNAEISAFSIRAASRLLGVDDATTRQVRHVREASGEDGVLYLAVVANKVAPYDAAACIGWEWYHITDALELLDAGRFGTLKRACEWIHPQDEKEKRFRTASGRLEIIQATEEAEQVVEEMVGDALPAQVKADIAKESVLDRAYPEDDKPLVSVTEAIETRIAATAVDKIHQEAEERERKAAEREAQRQRTKESRERKAAELAAAEASAPGPKAWLHCLPVAELHTVVTAGTVDSIICDPPYAIEYLSLYEDVGRFAEHALAPGGNLIVLTGNAHLLAFGRAVLDAAPELYNFWNLLLDMQSGQHQGLWQKGGSTGWKPFLWFRRKGADKPSQWWHDVIKDEAPDGIVLPEGTPVRERDDRYHKWGQNLASFINVVKQHTLPGQTVCDPFLGGGTTALASLMLGRQFIGADNDASCLDITRRRLSDEMPEPYELEA